MCTSVAEHGEFSLKVAPDPGRIAWIAGYGIMCVFVIETH